MIKKTTTTTTTEKIIEKPKRKRTTKAEKAEKAESKARQPEHITHEKFTAEIMGKQCEGILVRFEDRSIYLCQDFVVGGFISKKLRQGYKFSFYVGMGEVTSHFVKNFKIIN